MGTSVVIMRSTRETHEHDSGLHRRYNALHQIDWNYHNDKIIGKANRSLGFIGCDLSSCPERVKSQAYVSLVRPRPECACSAWEQHTQKRRHDIEGVQPENCQVREKLL